MTLADALTIKDREVISLVGGGGKSTLMFALGKELSSHWKGVILTTTTKIWEPAPSSDFALFLSDQLPEIKAWAEKNLEGSPNLLIARVRLAGGKLQGIDSRWVDELFSLPGVSWVIVEADGAAGRSLKAPKEGEPVVPQSTSLLIPVVGIDVLGCPLDEPYVFRSEIAARLLNLSIGSEVTEEVIAALLSETLKKRPPKARVIPFINKIDLPGSLEKGRKIGEYLVHLRQPELLRVILGQAQHSPAVKEVILSYSHPHF